MVLESLLPALNAERKPISMLPLAFLYSTIAMFIGLWIFPNYAGLTMVFFTVMALIPLMLSVINFEEKKIFLRTYSEFSHRDAIPFFVFMFLGTVLAFTFWFSILPEGLVNQLYQVQIGTIEQINSNISGGFSAGYFSAIVFNNFRVLFFVLLFSFIYGAGAIFILTWNASVIAVAIGNSIRGVISSATNSLGVSGAAVYFQAVSLGSIRYLLHGLIEIGAYFVGGLAGGLISVAVIRYKLFDERFNKVLIDSMQLVLISAGLLLLAAVVEVFISPLIPA